MDFPRDQGYTMKKESGSFRTEDQKRWNTILGFFSLLFQLLLLGTLWAACGGQPDTGEDPEVTTRGSFEVTAELTEIRGEFIDRADYDYAFVMKYKVLKVHRGQLDQEMIYVGHYNPLKSRDRVADERVTDVGGRLQKFRAGDVHRIALETPIDDFFMGGIVNRYFEEYTGPVYWAVWTNLVAK